MRITELVQEMLRNRLTDPRGTRDGTADSDTIALDGSTSYTLTPTTSGHRVLSITSVMVDSVAQTKWTDYTFNLDDQKITLTSDPGSGSMVVSYKAGTTHWIFAGNPRTDLGETSYPRISVSLISEPGFRTGNYLSDIHSTPLLQISAWAKEKQVFTVSGRTFEGDKLAHRLARLAAAAFRGNENDLYPILHSYTQVAVRDVGWEPDREAFHSVLELRLEGVNLDAYV